MRKYRGQTILEYTIIVGIVVVVLSYMGTSIRRGAQSLVKVTADQLGNQENADQDFDNPLQGYTQLVNTAMQDNKNRQVSVQGYVTKTMFNESTDMVTNTVTNAGFTQG